MSNNLVTSESCGYSTSLHNQIIRIVIAPMFHDEALLIIEKLIGDRAYWKSKSEQARRLVANLEPCQIASIFLDAFKKGGEIND